MKDSYVSYVIEEYVADGNFDALFGDGWIDEQQLAALIPVTCDYAFADYGIDSSSKYAGMVADIFEQLKASTAIVQQGDDYAGHWYRLRSQVKSKVLAELRAKNPAAKLVDTLGEEALKRALMKIVAEDGLRPMEEKWATNDLPSPPEGEGAVAAMLQAGPDQDYFKSEVRRKQFGEAVTQAVSDIESSHLSNSEKAQAHGYLAAAKALSETPEPPVDLIWNILGRANNLAGIGSFFLALITLIAMVVN